MLVYTIGICMVWLELLSIGLQKLTQILRLLHQLTCVLAISYSFAESRRQQKALRTPHVSHIKAFV
jgi:hypothetical protein